VRPIPSDQKAPELHYTTSFLEPNTTEPLRQPGMDKTGPVPIRLVNPTMPVEQLMQQMEKQKAAGGSPLPVQPATGMPASGTSPAPAGASGATGAAGANLPGGVVK
jgi:hypothetical protein